MNFTFMSHRTGYSLNRNLKKCSGGSQGELTKYWLLPNLIQITLPFSYQGVLE